MAAQMERRNEPHGPIDEMAESISSIAPNQLAIRRQHRPSLVDLAYDAIVEAIVDRRISPGTHIGIGALATQLEMSSTPIREALARAAAKRLVAQISNRGFVVTGLLSPVEYNQLWDVRFLLEMRALEKAVLEPVAINRLREIVAGMLSMEHGSVYRDFRSFTEADKEFHEVLVGMAENSFLVRAWSDLHFHLHVGRLYSGIGLVDYEEALLEHKLLVDLLADGERQTALAALSNHIQRAKGRLLSLVPSPDDPGTAASQIESS